MTAACSTCVLILLAFLVVAVNMQAMGKMCEVAVCQEGHICAPMLYKCSGAPCPRAEICITPGTHRSCTKKFCPDGQECILKQVSCDEEPCWPKPTCVTFPKCGDNEEYRECSRIGNCEETCEDRHPLCAPSICGAGACECQEGYVRHKGKCIDSNKCPEHHDKSILSKTLLA